MKKFVCIIMLVISVISPIYISAESTVSEQYNEMNLDKIIDISSEYTDENISLEYIADRLMKGENFINFNSVFGRILSIIANEIHLNINLIISLIILAIVSAILTNLQSAYENSGVSEVTFLACYSIFVILTISGFYECAKLAGKVITDQTLFMKMTLPTYISLMIATGNIAVAGTMEPIFLFLVHTISNVIDKVLLPLVFWISILSIINNFSGRFHVTKLIQFSRQAVTWAMAAMITFFVGTMSMSGITSSMTDGVALRTM